MDWLGLNHEQLLVRKEVAEFCRKEVASIALDLDRQGIAPTELFAKLAAIGAYAIPLPEAQGGANLGMLSTVVALEEVARVFPSLALCAAVQTIVALSVAHGGSEHLQKEVGASIACGADAAAMSLSDTTVAATATSFAMLIEGELDLIANGSFAQYLLLRLSSEGGTHWGLCKLPLPTIKSEAAQTIGFRASGLAKASFSAAEVNNWQVLKQIDERIVEWRSLLLAAVAVGICQGCLDKSAPYARARHQFGQPIAAFDMVRRLLGEISWRTAAARLITYDAAFQCDHGASAAERIAMAFACSREAAMVCADCAVQVFGGYGYTKDYQPEMFFRDAKFLEALSPSVSEARCRLV
ncbi:MAG: acyl-CoA dehydrogenase family protein [Candidatus Oleimicrobiaceae bacterium]